MHELPVINKILDICLKHAREARAEKIVAIELKVGALSDLSPEWMQRYFEFAAKDTIAADAVLEIEKTPAQFSCAECGSTFAGTLDEDRLNCPECGSSDVSYVPGSGYYISNMKVV